MMILAFAGFFLFTLMYAAIASAVVYHVHAYTLPGWSGGKTAIWLFLAAAAALFALSIYFFLQVPWEAFQP